MAKGDEWRYDDIGPRRDTSKISKHQISREAPEWMARVSSCVTATDHGSAHPFSFDGIKQKTDHNPYTHRIRDASACAKGGQVFVGGRKKFSKGGTKQSDDSPFQDPSKPNTDNSEGLQSKSNFVLKNGKYVPKTRRAKRPVTYSPFLTREIHHTVEFGKPSTAKSSRPGVGSRKTNVFYNSIGGWAAAGY